MSPEEKDQYLDRLAHKRAKMKMGFFIHAFVYVAVNAGRYVAMNYFDYMPRHGSGTWHPIWWWGVGLLIHGLVVYTCLPGGGFRERLIAREREALNSQHRAS